MQILAKTFKYLNPMLFGFYMALVPIMILTRRLSIFICLLLMLAVFGQYWVTYRDIDQLRSDKI